MSTDPSNLELTTNARSQASFPRTPLSLYTVRTVRSALTLLCVNTSP